MKNVLRVFCILNLAFCIVGCSIPNLEDPACIEARNAMREFYSFHFGNEMLFTKENAGQRERFLTPRLYQELHTGHEGTDPFTTGTSELPKAFRVGECRALSPDRTEFQVVLFWRDDVRNEERQIKAVAVKQGDKWLLDKVER